MKCGEGFLSEFPTELHSSVRGDGTCCRLHRKVVDVVGLRGCARWELGTHPSIRAIYDGTGRRHVCFAEDGVKKKDVKFARLMAGSSRMCAPLHAELLPSVRRYVKGFPVEITTFGAWYCSLIAIRPEVRMRVARVLGPLPLVADALRAINLVGRNVGCRCEWVCVAEGLYHVRLVKPLVADSSAMVTLFHDGLRLLREVGPMIRVGAGETTWEDEMAMAHPGVWHPRGPNPAKSVSTLAKFGDVGGLIDCYGDIIQLNSDKPRVEAAVAAGRVDAVRKFLGGCGVVMPPESFYDLSLVVHTAAVIPAEFVGGSARLKLLALIGDRAVKLLLALQGLAVGSTVASVQGSESKIQSNVSMVESAKKLGYVSMLYFAAGVPKNSPKVVGTSVEALLGVVALWKSMEDVKTVAELFSILERLDQVEGVKALMGSFA